MHRKRKTAPETPLYSVLSANRFAADFGDMYRYPLHQGRRYTYPENSTILSQIDFLLFEFLNKWFGVCESYVASYVFTGNIYCILNTTVYLGEQINLLS